MSTIRHECRLLIALVVLQLVNCVPLSISGTFECSTVKNCLCIPGASELEISCPAASDTPKITVRVEQPRIEIECLGVHDHTVYNELPPRVKIGHADMLKFKFCPMPTALIKEIMDRLGIQGIRTLIFSSKSDIDIDRRRLANLTTLTNLHFNGPLSHLAADTFDDLSNIKALEIRSSNRPLPTGIFKNLRQLEFLELGSNNLSILEQGLFHNQTNLKRLNLWSNNLRNLTKESFEGASSVTDLDLSANNIETFRLNVFEYLTNMTNINLNANRFTELPRGLFSFNKKLQKIRLMYNRVDLKTLPDGLLANLTELTEVSIVQCNLLELPEDLFAGSTNIRNLSLASNQLTTIPETLFYSQNSLINLDLSHNQLKELPDYVFNGTKLDILRLSHNNLETISRNVFFSLSQLSELHLDNNHLRTIDRAAFKPTTNLVLLQLENNFLDFTNDSPDPMNKDIQKSSPFEYTSSLKELILRNNSISQFLSSWPNLNSGLELLDLSHNNLSSMSLMDVTQIWRHPIRIDLSHNHIEYIISNKLWYNVILTDRTHEAQQATGNKSIEWEWNLNSNPFNCDCRNFYFVQFLRNANHDVQLAKHVKFIVDNLRCSGPENLQNQLVKNVKPSELLCKLENTEKEKHCPDDCECWVRTDDETVIFDCSNRNLTEVPSWNYTLAYERFELNIQNNSITHLPHNRTPGYESLTMINARNNKLAHISGDNLPKDLKELDISDNYLTTLETSFLMRLNKTNKIILEGNPWTCACDSDFLKSIQNNQRRVDYSIIKCADGELISSKSINCPMDKTILILVCILIALLGLFIGTVIALYYKYQQEVKVWLFAHNLCLWFVTEEELDKDKKYDAFISFSHKDEDFVTEQLVPELESGPHPFKICLHFRDWVVGEFIPNQISKSVEDSRRTIVVLTPNFLESIWGRMEFRAAHKNALAEGRTRLIVIIHGDIGDIDKLDPELKVYLKTNTYVKWGDPWFFDKLRYALPHPTNYKSKGLIKSTIKSSIDDKLELIKPQAVTPPLTTPPAEQAGHNPMISHLNGHVNGLNGLNGHVNGAFIINTNAKQSDV